MSGDKSLLTIGAVARATGYAADTLRRFARTGVVAPARDSIGRRLFTQRDIIILKTRRLWKRQHR